MNLDISRGRCIVPTADLSAFVALTIPLLYIVKLIIQQTFQKASTTPWNVSQTHLSLVTLRFSLLNRKLNLRHIRIIILTYRLSTIQVNFAIRSDNLVSIGLNPVQNSLVCLIERIEGTLVNDAGHSCSRNLVDFNSLTLGNCLFQENHCFAIDIIGL